MEITKTVPVTIEVDDDNHRGCSGNCCFNVEGRYCSRFDVTTIRGRNDGCISEFGTSEKPAVVPWQDSKIGDVVEIDCEEDGKRLVIPVSCDGMGWPDRCERCVCGRYAWSCPASIRDDEVELCSTHPSGCDIYFTEVKE